jgi:hypothetical protein
MAGPTNVAVVSTGAPARIGIAVGAWLGAITAAHLVLADEPLGSAPDMLLLAPPLHGRFDVRLGLEAVPAIAVGTLLVLLGGRAAQRLPWGGLLVGATAATIAWAVALAMVDGSDGLLRGVLGRTEYLADVARVHDIGALLRDYPDLVRARGLSAHSSGHPPGPLLVLVGLDRVGLGGPEPAAVFFVAGGAAAVPAVLVAAREVTDEAFARRAAPYLVLAPLALWIATSADALFAGVTAWAATAVVLATGRAGHRSDALAIAGGLAFGAALFLSYGLSLLAMVPLVVAIARRRWRPIAVATAATLPVALGFLLAGFSWIEGLFATRERYLGGIADHRPHLLFVVVNLIVLALVLGPIGTYACSQVRERGAGLLVGGAAIAVVLADLSGMSKAEVERIWLPFAVWLLAACGTLRVSARQDRALLGIQAAACVVLAVTVRTAW